MNNDNLTNKQIEFLKDLFIILSTNKNVELTKDNILDKFQDEIIYTMELYWALVDENNELKQKLNNLF